MEPTLSDGEQRRSSQRPAAVSARAVIVAQEADLIECLHLSLPLRLPLALFTWMLHTRLPPDSLGHRLLPSWASYSTLSHLWHRSPQCWRTRTSSTASGAPLGAICWGCGPCGSTCLAMSNDLACDDFEWLRPFDCPHSLVHLKVHLTLKSLKSTLKSTSLVWFP